MNLLLAILCLQLSSLPYVLCEECSQTSYGKYDIALFHENTRDEKIFLTGLKMSSGDEESPKEQITEMKECPELYQRYSTEHTYCKVSTCNIITEGINEDDKELILEIHNELRNKLANGSEERYRQLPSAANMMELEWDDELARVAQAHASLCVFKHDKSAQREVENFPVGQNLILSSGAQKDWNTAQMLYKEEVCFFFPEYIKPFHFEDNFGHFSQVTWATTWKIGCGFAAFRENEKTKSIYTCNYGPTGNVIGQTHYIVGEPCSKCPKNTECSEQYPALCKSKTEDGPQMERPSTEDYILFCDFSDNDPQECNNVKITGSRNLTTRHIYSGNYKTVVLERGESVSVDFGTAQNENGICPFLYIRFGPNNANDSTGSVLEISYSSDVIVPMPPTTIHPLGSSFFTAAVLINYGGPLKIAVKMRAEENAAPQYFDVKFWGIRKGSCKLFV